MHNAWKAPTRHRRFLQVRQRPARKPVDGGLVSLRRGWMECAGALKIVDSLAVGSLNGPVARFHNFKERDLVLGSAEKDSAHHSSLSAKDSCADEEPHHLGHV